MTPGEAKWSRKPGSLLLWCLGPLPSPQAGTGTGHGDSPAWPLLVPRGLCTGGALMWVEVEKQPGALGKSTPPQLSPGEHHRGQWASHSREPLLPQPGGGSQCAPRGRWRLRGAAGCRGRDQARAPLPRSSSRQRTTCSPALPPPPGLPAVFRVTGARAVAPPPAPH